MFDQIKDEVVLKRLTEMVSKIYLLTTEQQIMFVHACLRAWDDIPCGCNHPMKQHHLRDFNEIACMHCSCSRRLT